MQKRDMENIFDELGDINKKIEKMEKNKRKKVIYINIVNGSVVEK